MNTNTYRLIKHTHKDRLALYDLQVYSPIKNSWYTVFPNDDKNKVIEYCKRNNIFVPVTQLCLFAGYKI